MIEEFTLNNYLSFNSVKMQFQKGLIVFTGTSGSGKSILMQSILGLFGLEDPQAKSCEAIVNYPIGSDLIEKDDIYIYKQIKKEKVRYFINEQSISKKGIKTLSSNFIRHLSNKDYSDFEQSELLNLLDLYIDKKNKIHLENIRSFSIALQSYNEYQKKLKLLLEEQKRVVELKEFMRFEIQKINKINPILNEDDDLMDIKRQLSKKEKTKNLLMDANIIFEYEHKVSSILVNLDIDSSFFDDAFNQLRFHLEEAQHNLNDLDDINIEEVLNRIEALSDLKRRYGSIEEALAYKKEKEKDLKNYDNIDQNKEIYDQKIQTLKIELKNLADIIHQERIKVLPILEKKLNQYLKSLYLRGASLSLRVVNYNTYGQDFLDLELNDTALNKISSGEFNRLRLALLVLKSETSQQSGILFLDEIDANLSGEESMSVAKVLKLLSKKYQIFSISHQPQLTSTADQHFLVSRDKNSSVKEIFNESRMKEVARMISGDIITTQAIEFAKQLLKD